MGGLPSRDHPPFRNTNTQSFLGIPRHWQWRGLLDLGESVVADETPDTPEFSHHRL
jgi:hypothetical protein